MSGILGSEFQPQDQDFTLRINDQELRKAIAAVYSRGAFAVTTAIYTSTQSMDHRVSVALCDTSGGAFVLTIPYANYWGDDKSPILTFVHVAGAGNVTITASGSDTINGAATYALVPGDRIDLISDGASAWYVFSSAASSGLFVAKAGDTMTGQLVFKDGDSGSYAWTFTSTTTGMYYDSGMVFAVGNTPRWKINTSGHLIAVTDNSYDIGQSGATRPRNIYCSGLGIIGGLLTVGSLTSTSTVTFNGLTASLPVIANASKQIVSATQTGTGTQFVMSASPTITGTLTVGTIITFPSNVNLVQNSTNLWVVNASGSGPGAIYAGDAVDYDRAVKLDYTPGTTGATAGQLIIGQTNRNHANYTHGITSLYTNGVERVRINKDGVVGFGTTPGSTSTANIETAAAISSPTERSVHSYGAVGDYNPATRSGTDDATAIQAALDAAYTAGGGIVILEANKKYRVGSTLTIPIGVTLRGPKGHVGLGFRGETGYSNTNGPTAPTKAFRDMGGALWITFDAGTGAATSGAVSSTDIVGADAVYFSTRTAAIYLRGCIEDVYIFNKHYGNGLHGRTTDNATWSSTISSTSGAAGAYDAGTAYVVGNLVTYNSVQYYCTTNGTGQTPSSSSAYWTEDYRFSGQAIRQDAEDATIENCFIGGFMGGFLSYLESRPKVNGLWLDCMNGIEISSCFDVAYISKVHAFPFCTSGYSLGSLVRRGVFCYLHDTVDWAQVHDCFTYGHKFGYYLYNVGRNSICNCGADNTNAETSGYYGIKSAQSAYDTVVSNFHCANREYGAYFDIDNTHSASLHGFNAADVNTGVHVETGIVTISGAMIDVVSSGTRRGIHAASSSTRVVAINPRITNASTDFSDYVTIIRPGSVQFPATQQASSDTHALDDYEENTWTPVLTFATAGDLSVTYSSQYGHYTKIGRVVHIVFRIITSAFTHTTASGNLYITGCPFTSTNTTNNIAAGTCLWSGITKATYSQVTPYLQANGAVLQFSISGSGVAVADVAAGDVPSGGTVNLTGSLTYITA